MCRSGCATRDHVSWGECARAANLQVGSALHDIHQGNQRELQAYADARRQGVQPKGTSIKQTVEAMKFAEKTGVGDPWAH